MSKRTIQFLSLLGVVAIACCWCLVARNSRHVRRGAVSDGWRMSVLTSTMDGPAEFGVWKPLADRPLPQRDPFVCAFWRNGRYLVGLSTLGVKPGELLAGKMSTGDVDRLVDQLVAEVGDVRHKEDRVGMDCEEVFMYALRDKQQWSLRGPASVLYQFESTPGAKTATERIVRSIFEECKSLDLPHATKVGYWRDDTGIDPDVITLSEWP